MSLPAAEMQRRFDAAQRLLGASRAPEAKAMLIPVRDAAPGEPAVRQLMADVLVRLYDYAGAEAELRSALAALPPRDKRGAPVGMQLGVLLAHMARRPESEAALRAAVAADRRFLPATGALADFLITDGRAQDALKLLEPLRRVEDYAVASAHGEALRALGRRAEAVDQHRRAAAAEPQNPVAWHNLASAEGDLQRFAGAEAATAKALALGLDAPETWLVRGRALQGLERWDEARAAFREALRRRPAFLDAHRDLAHLIWMRTGDAVAATAEMDRALAAIPDFLDLVVERARVLQYAGDLAGADAALAEAAERPNAPPRLMGSAAQMAVKLDPERAARYAQDAVAAAPGDDDMVRTLAEVRLAQGDWRDAARLADGLVARTEGLHQGDLMLQHTAWRMGDDVRRAERDDYDGLVRARTIDAPKGWADLPAYLRDLAAGLERLHTTEAHPIGQSLRGGTQTNANLLESDDPAVRAFPQAVDGAIRAYMAALGPGDDPVRRRNTGKYRFSGIWSVRLRTSGHHADHIHPAGWLSSACYIAVPPVVDAGGHEGWIKFGEPGVPTRPPLGPERFEKPEPGKLVLFPSYMWHGTVPFSGDVPRLTVAFDLVPA